MRRRFFLTSHGGQVINTNNYLTIVALGDGLTASLSLNDCEYCVDGDGDWKALIAGTSTEPVNAGQTLSFRAELTPNSSSGIGTFTISNRCNLLGNCMSMLFGDNAADNFSLEGKDDAFRYLFRNSTNIVNVSNDFLPATTLANYCYYYMFFGCTSLVNAPELPATTLANYCYSHMFRMCGALNYIKMLATDISATNCLYFWVSDVPSSGTFVKNSAMTSLPTGVDGIPRGWTVKNA